MTQNETLSPKQQRAIQALLTNPTLTGAAVAAKISRSTLGRWLLDPLFNQALKAGAAASLEELSRSLLAVGGKAIQALGETLDKTGLMQAGVRVRAADIVLSRLLALRELVDLEARISELEKVVKK